jgi:membrane protein implicated in regulation of membrane protease activity
MSNKQQIVYIGLLFLGLMLLSAGIGALAAGEVMIGGGLLVGGILLTGIVGFILYYFWKRSKLQTHPPHTDAEDSTDNKKKGE